MKWDDFYRQFGGCAMISPQMVYATGGDWRLIQVQISRWVASGKLLKLAREKYIFSETYRKRDLSRMYIANQVVYPSYVSLEYALSFYGLIPEAVFSVTSLTSLRPMTYNTSIGTFIYRHIKQEMFWGYEAVPEGGDQAMIACAEKALLDTFYFWNGEISEARVTEMRFQNLDQIDADKLLSFVKKVRNKKIEKIIRQYLLPLIEEEKKAA